MRITCPFCGDRPGAEFAYRGDAGAARPRASADPVAVADDLYLRDNPAGPHREHWQHVGGCRSWLVVTRDTRDHAVLRSEPAPGAAR